MSFSTEASLRSWERKVSWRRNRLLAAKRAHDQARVNKWRASLKHAVWMVSVRKKQLDTLQKRALRAADALVGVMEQGGNNTGPMVNKIIKANGGDIGEPWCGDFIAYCYRQAGSKACTSKRQACSSKRSKATQAQVVPCQTAKQAAMACTANVEQRVLSTTTCA